MSSKGIISQERVSDSSDNESTSTDPTQTLRDQVKKTLGSKNSHSQSRTTTSDDTSTSSDSDTSSKSSNTSRSSKASKRKAQNTARPVVDSPVKRTKTGHSNAKRVEAPSYLPPAGFSKLNTGDLSSLTSVTNALSNIGEKQVWHLAVSSDMPISRLTEIDISAALKGEPILEHKGVKYVMTGSRSDQASVLLPRGRDATYTSANATISRSFCIQESYTDPAESNVAGVNDDEYVSQLQFFATETGQTRIPRQQPANLKSRNVPYGVARVAAGMTGEHDISMVDINDVVSDADVTMQDTPKSLKKLKTKHATDRQRDSTASSDIARSSQVSLSTKTTTASKEKKKKKDKSKSQS